MRRADTLLLLAVGAFAIFVGRQAVTTRRALAHERQNARSAADTQHAAPATHAAPTTQPQTAPATPAAPPAATPPTGRDPRRDVPGSYFSDMAADLKGQLVRWPDRREQGLRIWVQSASTIHDWDLRYAQMARDAFDDWGTAGLPLRFDFILDSASADIRIVWNEQFAAEQGQRVGTTLRTNDQNGWLTAAQILVAIHDSTGGAIPPAGLAGIVRHEAGHALGLGHSNDPRTKMYPIEMVDAITAADRTTLRLLYEFPPGTVR